jgi:hypothetical protein
VPDADDVDVTPAQDRGRLQVVAPVVAFDVAGPLAVYYSLRAAGVSTVTSLVLSGVVPAIGLALGVARHRRLDALGALVLLGIATGVLVGLVSHSARLVLLDGAVPTVVFGICCIGSLWARRPLIFHLAVEAMGADTPKGRDFAEKWRYPGFRRAFRIMTVVWGAAYVVEAAAQALIIETASASVAKLTSTVMPLAVAGVVAAWTVAYGRRGRRAGELAEAAARLRHEGGGITTDAPREDPGQGSEK